MLSAIRELYHRRSLTKLGVFHVAHSGDQLLRLFAERIELFSLVQILHQRVPVRVILELLNQSFDVFLTIRVFFLDGLSEENLEFCNQRYRDRFPCTSIADFLRYACDVCPREVTDTFPCT